MRHLWIAAAIVAVIGIGSCSLQHAATPSIVTTQGVTLFVTTTPNPDRVLNRAAIARYVYVVDRISKKLLVYPAAVQNPPPVRTIAFDSQPIAVATDATGQVYVTCWNSTVTIFDRGAAHQIGSMTADSSGINQPSGIVVDASGNLWVANRGAGSSPGYVAEYSPAGNPTRGRTIALPKNYLASGIAVDDSGNLWVDMMPQTGGGFVAQYAAPAYKATTVLATAGNGGLAFDARGHLRVGTISNLLDFAPPTWKRDGLGYYGEGYDIWRLTARDGVLYVPMASHGSKPSQVLEIDSRSAAMPVRITQGLVDPEGAAAGI